MEADDQVLGLCHWLAPPAPHKCEQRG
jgi:hypothetical protein